MNKSLGLCLVLLVVFATLSAAWWRQSVGESLPKQTNPAATATDSTTNEINDCIQERLHKSPGFGSFRIANTKEHLPNFSPKNDRETAAVAHLKQKGINVGFYLASRRVLWNESLRLLQAGEIRNGHWVRNYASHAVIGDPISLTGQDLNDESSQGADIFPATTDVWTVARKALLLDKTKDEVTERLRGWIVDVRLVRADSEKCLKCHPGDAPGYERKNALSLPPGAKSKLEIGDPLGVAIYVYRSGK